MADDKVYTPIGMSVTATGAIRRVTDDMVYRATQFLEATGHLPNMDRLAMEKMVRYMLEVADNGR